MSNLAIEVTGLRKKFGNQAVLDSVDLAVPAGMIYALLGPNGAGKTTLIHILTTLVTADEGTAKVFGYDVAADKENVKRSISLTGQFAAVDEVLTGEENLRMICRLSGLTSAEARNRTAELLRHFDLTPAANKRVKTYSGGMRRRLDLAISLVIDRPVLFLDEPTTGLDTMSRRAVGNHSEAKRTRDNHFSHDPVLGRSRSIGGYGICHYRRSCRSDRYPAGIEIAHWRGSAGAARREGRSDPGRTYYRKHSRCQANTQWDSSLGS